MAIRKCPACLTTAGMGAVVSSADENLVCAGCGQHLEVQEASRVLAATVGVAAGYLAVRYAPSPHSLLGWAMPALFALLAYSCFSALTLMFTADLVLRPRPVEPAGAAAASHAAEHD